ncbi:22569_t:CDS:2, partial [Dentiscutata erythropus]
AHAFANQAEEFEEKELWAKAMEAHFHAADQFVLTISYTSDSEVARTLKLLYATHNRQGKELQRRIEKQAQQSPKQPQERLSTPTSIEVDQNQGSSSTLPTTYLSSQHALGVQIPSNNNEKMLGVPKEMTTTSTAPSISLEGSSCYLYVIATTSIGVSKEMMTISTAPSISLEGSSSSEKIGDSYM